MSVKSLAVILALVISCAVASPAKKSNYIEQENSCREVCGLCDCDGFYCEDECICECNLEEDENLQCIADMEKECDANGLEYELLMQDSAKERFMREVKGGSIDLNKHLVILKQKRQSASTTTEPIVAAPEPSSSPDPIVAAPQNASFFGDDNLVGAPLSALVASLGGKAAISGLPSRPLAPGPLSRLQSPKLLVLLREHLSRGRTPSTSAPLILPKISITTRSPAARYVLPTFNHLPTFGPVQPFHLLGSAE